jgi:hypothetical protein
MKVIHAYKIGGPKGRELGNQPATEWKCQISNTFLWGYIRDDIKIDDALGDGTRLDIEELKIEKNFLFALITIITLGIWEPIKISWRCAKPKHAP